MTQVENVSSSLLASLGGAPQHEFTCSRAGCHDPANWKIVWRNPKIHTEDRRKTWLACEAHVGFLREFLLARDFPLDVVSINADVPAGKPDASSAVQEASEGTLDT